MNFTVYKSSAGSGKTYTLVKEYLKIALKSNKPDTYHDILAITFTNKATSEMKERVLGALKALSAPDKLSQANSSLQKELMAALNISESLLSFRAGNALTHILHHYSDFSISTIDRFVHKIVRTFARDLNIPVNFEVELDADSLLHTAIDELLSKAGTDTLLTKMLVDFTESKADEEKSWKIEKDLFDFSSEMLKEDSMEFIEKLKETSLSDFFSIREALIKHIKFFETEIKKIGGEALSVIKNAGIPPEAFAGGRNGIARYFSYLSECRADKLEPSVTIQNYVANDKWFAAKVSAFDRENINGIKNVLADFFYKAVKYISENCGHYFLSQSVLRHIYSLAVLRELEMIIDKIKSERNIVHISEFNKRIAAVVTKESAPFIYERIGEKYRHFLVDEFQDTSSLQWLNLLPLIHNSLSEGNFNMLVGDGKQAIYRWRSGDVEQFARLPKLTNSNSNAALAERELALCNNYNPQILKWNFRSKKELVEFNNYFFGELALKLGNDHKSIYHQHQQEFKAENTGGLVNIEILREEMSRDIRQDNFQRTLSIIREALNDNFNLCDICILCRKNSDAGEMAAFLLSQAIDVISSESLLLSQSPEINFIVSFLNFLHQPSEKKFQAAMAIFLVEHGYLKTDLHQTLFGITSEYPANNHYSFLIRRLNEAGYAVNPGKLKKLTVYELSETLANVFSLPDSSLAYLSSFLEMAHTFSQKESTGIPAFLEYWERKKNTASVVLPEGMNAVRIMSVHKSKGLEFPVVIFPFANWAESLTKDFFWVENPGHPPELKAAIVDAGKNLEKTVLAPMYEEEKSKSMLDNFNLLYVAFTRAKERLYVLSSEERQKTLSKNIIEILQKHPGWNEERFSFLHGEKTFHTLSGQTEHPANSSYPFQRYVSEDWQQKVRIRSLAEKWQQDPNSTAKENQKIYGRLLHQALAMIHTENDIEDSMEKLTVMGICSESEKYELKEKIKNLLAHPEIRPFFTAGLNIKCEAEILLNNGEIYRPDRVILNGNKAILVDYKTGIPSKDHREQVGKYAKTMAAMGYNAIEKYLIYTEEEKVVKIE